MLKFHSDASLGPNAVLSYVLSSETGMVDSRLKGLQDDLLVDFSGIIFFHMKIRRNHSPVKLIYKILLLSFVNLRNEILKNVFEILDFLEVCI